jgi:hypothetical protein
VKSAEIKCPNCGHGFHPNDVATSETTSRTTTANPTARLTPEALVTFDKSIYKDLFSSNCQTSATMTARVQPLDSNVGAARLLASDAATPIGVDDNRKADLDGRTHGLVAPDSNPADFNENQNPAAIQLNPFSADSVHSAILQRKKKQRLFYFVVNSFLGALTLVFAGFLYWKLSSLASLEMAQGNTTSAEPPTADGNLDAPELGEIKPAPQSTEELTGTQVVNNGELKKSVPDLPMKPPARPVFQFFTPKQVDEIWKNAKPNLVLLDIEGPLGKQRAVGTIVDSRGWVLTSYQAVKEAWRIEVTAAEEPLDRSHGAQPLVDLVRGFVAQDPNFDFAVLAINRRFVVSLAEVNLTKQNRIVPLTRLLSAAPPTMSNYYGVHEVQVDQRSKVEGLGPDIQFRIRQRGIGTPELDWLTLRGQSDWLPGTPLFDTAGIVQAMVSFPQNDVAVAIPLERLRSILSKASGKLTPLKAPGNTDGVIATSPSGELQPLGKLLEKLDRTANACREFHWLPANEDQYQTLVAFFQSYLECKTYLLANPKDYRDSEAITASRTSAEQRIKQLQQELLDRLNRAIQENDVGLQTLNRLAANELKTKENRLVPFWGNVHEGGVQLDRFIVQFNGGDTYCIVPFDPEAQVMRPGTHWLMIVETKVPHEPSNYRLGNERRVLAYPALQRAEIGPLQVDSPIHQ